jgi:NAD dependent epimerase/dehydratase family enzyme
MKIVLAGGTGQVGTLLARAFQARGDDVVVLSRHPAAAPWRTAAWDARTFGPWATELDGAHVVINLAGRNVNCRYTAENRAAIMASRVESTRAVGAAIATPRTRKVLLRAAMVMSPDPGGIFDTLLRLVRFGLGGAAAGGRQYVSWIHDADFVRAIMWLIEHPELDGPVNLAAPNPLPYATFMRAIRDAWRMPIGLPATRWMLTLGAWAMRTETELVLKSRRVVPGRLLDSGFAFEFSEWPAAAHALCDAWRARAAT